MDKNEKAQLIKHLIAAGVGAAGIGAFIRMSRARKARAEALNTKETPNAIVVDIKKSKFMEGLPTPESLAESRGETEPKVIGSYSSSTGNNNEDASTPALTGMSPDEIAARKRDILKGRKFDFFGKAASTMGVTEKVAKSPGDYNWLEGLWNAVIHPVDTLGVMWNAAKDKPVMWTAGTLGSIYLAAKISDVISKNRKKRAKENMELARDEYISALQAEDGEEKVAQADDDPRVLAGAVLGGAFVVPLALTAVVMNRIIANRKAEKKKQKQLSNSYPDEPLIMYKTSEDESISVSPETAIFLISAKRDLMVAAEMMKSAAGSPSLNAAMMAVGAGWDKMKEYAGNAWDYAANKFKGWAPEAMEKFYPMGIPEAQNVILSMMENEDNDEHLYSMANRLAFVNHKENDFNGMVDDLYKMAPREDPIQMYRLSLAMGNPETREKVIQNIMTSPRLGKLMAGRVTDDRFKDTWGKIKNDRLDEWLGQYLVKDGPMYNILKWIIQTTGIDNYYAKKEIDEQLAKYRSPSADASQAGTQAGTHAGTSQAQIRSSVPRETTNVGPAGNAGSAGSARRRKGRFSRDSVSPGLTLRSTYNQPPQGTDIAASAATTQPVSTPPQSTIPGPASMDPSKQQMPGSDT